MGLTFDLFTVYWTIFVVLGDHKSPVNGAFLAIMRFVNDCLFAVGATKNHISALPLLDELITKISQNRSYCCCIYCFFHIFRLCQSNQDPV